MTDDAVFEPRPAGEQVYRIDLASLSNIFQAGHRIRLTLHQVNSTDAAPAEKSTSLLLQSAELSLNVEGGEIPLEALTPCYDCDGGAMAQESRDAFKKEYFTGGIEGLDPESGKPVSLAFHIVRHTADQQVAGRLAVVLPDGNSHGVLVHAFEESVDPAYHYRFEFGDQVTGHLRCAIEDDPGTVMITTSSTVLGPIQVSDGSIRCYDVPYVNW